MNPASPAPVVSLTLNPLGFGTVPTRGTGTLKVSVDSANVKGSSVWKVYTTPDGAMYYHNKDTNVTQWQQPADLILPSSRVKLQVSDTNHSTTTKHNTCHPSWKETFEFKVPTLDSICSEELKLSVLNGNTVVGQANIGLHTLYRAQTTVRKVKLGKHAGDAVLVLTAVDFGMLQTNKPVSKSRSEGQSTNTPQKDTSAVASDKPSWDYSTRYSSPKRLYRVSGVGEHLPFVLSPNRPTCGETSNIHTTPPHATSNYQSTSSGFSGGVCGHASATSPPERGWNKVYFTGPSAKNTQPLNSPAPAQFSSLNYPHTSAEYPTVGYDYFGCTSPTALPPSPRSPRQIAPQSPRSPRQIALSPRSPRGTTAGNSTPRGVMSPRDRTTAHQHQRPTTPSKSVKGVPATSPPTKVTGTALITSPPRSPRHPPPPKRSAQPQQQRKPAKSPTRSPTKSPTKSPAKSPTKSPTKSPAKATAVQRSPASSTAQKRQLARK
eukprot:TRINITY_DN64142_c0_g1_i1.p1 TRINITY_DN64142_c0_g1~~TRINITY_DN64142_c0_g1_i1.p1  ORF type:complete len:563 (+),score=44.98 TRINITY_DN64142_c0_g1_i1:217-1689(+)